VNPTLIFGPLLQEFFITLRTKDMIKTGVLKLLSNEDDKKSKKKLKKGEDVTGLLFNDIMVFARRFPGGLKKDKKRKEKHYFQYEFITKVDLVQYEFSALPDAAQSILH